MAGIASAGEAGDLDDGSGAWLADLYIAQFASLVRLAALLLDRTGEAEEVVQDAYLRVAGSRRRLRDPEKALAYLRQSVVNQCRDTLRRRLVAARHDPAWSTDPTGADEADYAAVERQVIVQALRRLPRRSREVLVLRYYADLSVAQVADILRISVGAVKAYTSRGLVQLAAALEES